MFDYNLVNRQMKKTQDEAFIAIDAAREEREQNEKEKRDALKRIADNSEDGHIISRAKMMLIAIENATGKTISGKDSREVISCFGEALI